MQEFPREGNAGVRHACNAKPDPRHGALRLVRTPVPRTTGAKDNASLESRFYGCFVPQLYHDDRTHLGLEKETPAGREKATSANLNSEIISMPRLGGLHHRYNPAA
jgi:hypothetical protein